MPAPLMTNADPIWLPQEALPLFSLAVERTVKSLEVPMAMLAIVTNTAEASGSDARDGISIVAEAGFGKIDRQQRRGYLTLIRHAIDRRTTLHLNNLESEPKIFGTQAFYEAGGRSAIATPIFSSSDTCLGAIVAVSKVVKGFVERDIYCLQTIADWLGSEFDRHVLLQAQVAQWGKYWDSRDLKDASLDLPAIENELISHLTQELRTPLTCILGMSSILQKHIHGSLSDKQQSYLKIIHNSGEQLLKTIEEIENINALLADESILETEPIDLESLSIQAIKKLESLALGKGYKIELFFRSERNIWLLNRSRIELILYYLIFNAIEAGTAKNCTTITIYNALSKEDRRERLTIDITNSNSSSQSPDELQDIYRQMTLCLCSKLAATHQGKLTEISINPFHYQLILPTNFDMGNSSLN
jgi:hypothetical protein